MLKDKNNKLYLNCAIVYFFFFFRNAGSPCKYTDSISAGSGGKKPWCKQRYIYRQLVAIDASSNQLTKKNKFKMPSCCQCILSYEKPVG